ncbi:MAG TPA: hypothetical protein VGM10_14890 [Actinocrinis sp.]
MSPGPRPVPIPASVPLRAVAGLARVEAWRMARSILVLAGFAAGGLLVWVFTHGTQPVWWNGAWAIGYGQTALSVAVLIAAQLATGRARRDGMSQLYDSLPAGAGRRTLAHLLGLLGSVPAAVVLAGVVAGVFELHGVVGSPDFAALAGGVVLVLAGGAIGVAVGRRFPHPLAGVLAAFVWFIPFSQSNRISGPVTWLFPWIEPAQLRELPGPMAGYPPALAHTMELAAIAVLAAALALAAAATAKRTRIGPLVVAAAAVVAIVATCGVQMQPVPAQDVQSLVSGNQHCTADEQVRYCLYPEFTAKTALLQSTVRDVLAHAPAQSGRTLTIAQFTGLTLDDGILTNDHSSQQVDAWRAEIQSAPANRPSSSSIFLNLGSWPTGGQSAGDARFDLALSTAAWAVGLPTNTGTGTGGSATIDAGPDALPEPCVALNQAREAIAIWLAAKATTLPPAQFQDVSGRISGDQFAQVGGSVIVTWTYPGEGDDYGDYLASPSTQTTAAGYLLAQAMTRLPAARVAAVLAAGWSTWTNPQTTDTHLAAALGIAMPAVPTGLLGPHGQLLTPPQGAIPAQPECTS